MALKIQKHRVRKAWVYFPLCVMLSMLVEREKKKNKKTRDLWKGRVN